MDSSLRQAIHRLQELDPYEFEHLVGELWEIQGYETVVKEEIGDRGIDVIASKNASGDQERVLIQAKRYSGSNRVCSEEVRKYATLYQQEQNVDSVAIVTTNGFTDPGKTLANDLDVETYDEKNIIDIIKNGTDAVVSDEYEAVKRFLNKAETDPADSVSDSRSFSSDCPNCGSDRLTWNGRTRMVECRGCTETFKYRDGDIVSSDRGRYGQDPSNKESQSRDLATSGPESTGSHTESSKHQTGLEDSCEQQSPSVFDKLRSIFNC